MRVSWLVIFTVLSVGELVGQRYITAVGMRLGPAIGVTIQQRILERTTIEAIVQHRNFLDQTSAGLVLEKHLPLLFKRLNFYTGAGIQKTWYQSPEYTGADPWGAQVIFGAELSLARLNLSWDFKPVITLSSGDPLFQGQSAISLRYIILKQKRKKLFGQNKGKRKKRRKT